MLPHNAKVIRPNQVAIVFDDDNKGIHIWRNSVSNWKDFHPCWYLDRIVTLSEFDILFPHETLPENIQEALMWFWYDCFPSSVEEDHADDRTEVTAGR